jgi:ribosomal protein L37AE/L43A
MTDTNAPEHICPRCARPVDAQERESMNVIANGVVEDEALCFNCYTNPDRFEPLEKLERIRDLLVLDEDASLEAFVAAVRALHHAAQGRHPVCIDCGKPRSARSAKQTKRCKRCSSRRNGGLAR